MQQLESLEAWRCGNDLARQAYRLTMHKPLTQHFGLADQIRRSAISIPANMVEGYALGTTMQFVRCLRIAFGSTAELRIHLAMARDLGVVAAADADPLIELADRVIRLLVGLLRKLGARTPARPHHS